MQSRMVSAKCLRNGELSAGRKAICLWFTFRIPLQWILRQAAKVRTPNFIEANLWKEELLMSIRGLFHYIWRKTVAAFADYPKVFTGLSGNIRASAAELWNVRSLCGMALMLALGVVVDQFSFYVGPIKIGVGSIISAMLGCFYGPVAGGFAAGTGDLIKYLVRPTGAFFFGYTLNAMLGGMFYGLFLYKAKATLPRVVSAKLLINIVVNGLLGTLWYSMLYGKGFNAIFGVRMLANLGKVPVESIVLLIILPAFITVLRRAKVRL